MRPTPLRIVIVQRARIDLAFRTRPIRQGLMSQVHVHFPSSKRSSTLSTYQGAAIHTAARQYPESCATSGGLAWLAPAGQKTPGGRSKSCWRLLAPGLASVAENAGANARHGNCVASCTARIRYRPLLALGACPFLRQRFLVRLGVLGMPLPPCCLPFDREYLKIGLTGGRSFAHEFSQGVGRWSGTGGWRQPLPSW